MLPSHSVIIAESGATMETQLGFDLEQLAVDAFLSASAACVPNDPAGTRPECERLCDAALTLNAAYMGELLSGAM